jgi:formylglycine-generating enzyme required for sulfatase activity/pimeloyl-ACP methyl ester carboxylesterase
VKKPQAYRGSEPFAFIAYSHQDTKAVFDELRWMANQGFRAFYDDGIHPGHRWREEIADAIDDAALFVFFVTSRSVSSDDCIRELNYAVDQGRPILAVHLEQTDLPGGVRLTMSDRQAILAFSMHPDDYRVRFREALGEHLKPNAELSSDAIPRAPAPAPVRSRPTSLIAALLFLGLAGLVALGFWWDPSHEAEVDPGARPETARPEAFRKLREAEALIEDDRYGEAFYLLREIGQTLEDDPDLGKVEGEILETIAPRISESGASLAFRPRQIGTDLEWIDAAGAATGLPAPQGVLELRASKPGFRTVHYLVANPGPLLGNHFEEFGRGPFPEIELTPEASAGRVRIPASNLSVILQGTPQSPEGTAPADVPAFEIDQTEVTNRAFKAFVDAGGYQDPAFWEGLTFPDGRAFDLEADGELLTDTTGRRAPAGWELGTYPPGAGDLPVGGISWFEAMAYARFMGAELPTAYHWARAAQGVQEAAYATVHLTARLGNFNSDGPRPASAEALGPWGTWDMAGNMREWVQNATSQGRVAMGGSWNDYESNYFQVYSMRPLERLPDNGLRLIYPEKRLDPALTQPLTLLTDSPRPLREPASDAFYEGMLTQFVPPRETPGQVRRTILDENSERRIEEFVLEYPSEEDFTFYVATPAGRTAPLQPVIYMPHGGAFNVGPAPNRSAVNHLKFEVDFIYRSGRAAIVPVWAGSYRRYVDAGRGRIAGRAVPWYADAVRMIDYLETDPSFDAERVAFLGFSYGALFGPVILAMEERFRTGVLISGGIFSTHEIDPTADVTNYAPRIQQPILMVNGRFDPIVPYGLSQQRLLELLPNPGNRQVLFDELGHYGFPRHRFYRAVTNWLDEQLGPVR